MSNVVFACSLTRGRTTAGIRSEAEDISKRSFVRSFRWEQ